MKIKPTTNIQPRFSFLALHPIYQVPLALFCLALLLVGCDDNHGFPVETTLVDSHGNGGWVLFDSAPENYDRGHTVPLEEQVKVRVIGQAVNGRLGDTKLYPVTVVSGKSAGRSGWVSSTALNLQ